MAAYIWGKIEALSRNPHAIEVAITLVTALPKINVIIPGMAADRTTAIKLRK